MDPPIVPYRDSDDSDSDLQVPDESNSAMDPPIVLYRDSDDSDSDLEVPDESNSAMDQPNMSYRDSDDSDNDQEVPDESHGGVADDALSELFYDLRLNSDAILQLDQLQDSRWSNLVHGMAYGIETLLLSLMENSHRVQLLKIQLRESFKKFIILTREINFWVEASMPKKAAALRLLLALGFYGDDLLSHDVLSGMKELIIREASAERCNNLDWEMLVTYGIGLMSLCLDWVGQEVEDAVRPEMAGQLIGHLSLNTSCAISTDEHRGNKYPSIKTLIELRKKYSMHCLQLLSKNVKFLDSVLKANGAKVYLQLLQENPGADIIELICAATSHEKFAATFFVGCNAMEALVTMPRDDEIILKLSLLLRLSSQEAILERVMERVCSSNFELVEKLVHLALHLLECSWDQARKNAALFFSSAFVSREVVFAFDAQGGLLKLLAVLKNAVIVDDEIVEYNIQPITYHSCFALRQYFRASLVLCVDANKRKASKPLDIRKEAIDALLLELDRKLGLEFPAVDQFLSHKGHTTILDLIEAHSERHLQEDALDVLYIVTLARNSCATIRDAVLSNKSIGAAVILRAANVREPYVRNEVVRIALQVIVNLVEQNDRCTREVICANNGIRILLPFLKESAPPTALACRILLALARDGATAHMLKVFQIGETLSALIDSENLTNVAEQGRWQSELSELAIELIRIVINSGNASTLAVEDIAVPTFRRIERESIAADTPITYHSRELLDLVLQHLQACGLAKTAESLQKEARLTLLPAVPSSCVHQSVKVQWPSRTSSGFLSNKKEDGSLKCIFFSHQKSKPMVSRSRKRIHDWFPSAKRIRDESFQYDLNESTSLSTLCEQPTSALHSIVLQYLTDQHRRCPAPKTTLPPLSLLRPHICEPRQTLDSPQSITARLKTREFRSMYGSMYCGIHGNRRDRLFSYSRFCLNKPCLNRDDPPLTSISYLNDSVRLVVGDYKGDVKILDSNSNCVLHSFRGHLTPVTLIQTRLFGTKELVLSSSLEDVNLWEASIEGPLGTYERCRAARFSNSADAFAVMAGREILLYDIKTNHLLRKMSDMHARFTGHGRPDLHLYFNPTDTLLLWNGALWDTRASAPLHHFEQFMDYGGGGFHPSRNEVITNSEIWDLRNYKVLHHLPVLNQTTLTFNSCGDVLYSILRRNLGDPEDDLDDVSHPLLASFGTMDALTYSNIATIPVNGRILDFATEPTDSLVAVLKKNAACVYRIGLQKPTDSDDQHGFVGD